MNHINSLLCLPSFAQNSLCDSSLLLHIISSFFLLLDSILLYEYTTPYPFFWVLDILSVFQFYERLPTRCFCRSSFLLSKVCMVNVKRNYFTQVVITFYIPSNNIWEFKCLYILAKIWYSQSFLSLWWVWSDISSWWYQFAPCCSAMIASTLSCTCWPYVFL